MTEETTAARVRDRLAGVQETIGAALERSGRDAGEARVLLATKYYEPWQVSAVLGAGAGLVGENTAQELARKQERWGDRFEWHFIGHLQRRKAKDVLGRVSLIHSVDSVRLIEELRRRAPESGADVLLQVNVSGEEAKYGVAEREVEALLETAAESGGSVNVRGLMTVAPEVEEPEDVRYVFAKLRILRDSLAEEWGSVFDLSELSMGTSNDYAVAVEEGATLVRIGREIVREDGP